MLTIEEYLKTPSEIEKELLYFFAKNDQIIILDIGSCTGEDSIKYNNLFPFAKIFAFEPVLENVLVMQAHFKQYNKAIQIQNFALSDTNGEADFHLSSGTPFENVTEENFTTLIPKVWNKSNSLFPPSSQSDKHLPWLKFNKKQRVKTQRLDTFLAQNNISEVDFIHMDVQGAELKVLLGAGEKINNIKSFWLEVENVELYKGQPLKNELCNFLSKHNFILLKDTSKGKMAGDCFFINKNYFGFFKRLVLKFL